MIVSGHQVRKKEGNGLVFENYKLCGVLDWSDTCLMNPLILIGLDLT